ncbi:MAG: hypothetical protein ACKOHH_11320, partial [Bacteroidota bacterium]
MTLRTGTNIGFGGTWPSATIAARQFTGGFSYRSASGRDLRAVAFAAPTLPVLGGSTSPVSLTIQNSAADPITSAQVGYQLNNGTVVTETWTGNLASGQTTTHTFNGNITIPSQGNFTLKGFIGNANGLGLDNNPANDTIHQTLCPSISGSFTVGTGGDFASLSTAITQFNVCGTSGPITLNLLPGIHNGTTIIPSYPGAVNGLTIQSSTGNRDDVLLTNGSTVGHVLFLDNAQNITLQNISLRLQYPSTAPSAQISALNISGGNNVTVTNCSFVADSIATSTFNRNISIVNCQNLLIQNSLIRDGYYGIYHTGSTAPAYSLNNRFIGNTFSNQYFYGAYFLRMGGIEFKGNRINSTRTGTTGTTSSYALRLDNCKGLDVSGNQIMGTFGAYGIYFGNCQMDTVNNRRNRMFYNVLSAEFTNKTAPRA